MSKTSDRPVIGIAASLIQHSGNQMAAHSVGQRYVESLEAFSNCLPVVIPARADHYDFKELLSHFDGIVLTGGRANVEPHHYGGPPFPEDEPIDPARDNLVLSLIRACVDHKMPVFGSCRGLQEMNVALGGTLHYRLHTLEGKNDHRMPRHEGVTREEIFALRHTIQLTPGGLFQGLVGRDQFDVNTLHGQGIDRLADDFEIEAVTVEDEVIEGIRLKNDETFTVGVQWHAEWYPEKEEYLLSRRLYEEFGKAAREYQQRK